MKKNLKNLYRRWRKLDKFERRELRVWLYQGVGFLLLTTICPVFIVNSVYTFCILMVICQKIGRLRFERYCSTLHIRMYDRLSRIHEKNIDALEQVYGRIIDKNGNGCCITTSTDNQSDGSKQPKAIIQVLKIFFPYLENISLR